MRRRFRILTHVVVAAIGAGLFPEAANADLVDGLVGYWTLNEGEGSTAHDDSGNGNDGTIYGAAWTTGVSEHALGFDGVDDFVNCGNDVSLKPTSGLTVSFWYKAGSQTEAYAGIICNMTGQGPYVNRGYKFTFHDLTSTGLFFYIGEGPDWDVGYTGVSFGDAQDSRWHHVVGAYDGSEIRLYRDTALQSSKPWSKLGVSDDDHYFGVDSYGGVGTRRYHGTLDQVRIYNRALSPTEIQELYDQPGILRVTGTVRFVAEDGQTYPAKYVEVNVYDEDVGFDDLIVSGFTDENGVFYFDRDSDGDLIWNEDSEPFGGARDIYVEVLARNEATTVSSTVVGQPYGGSTETVTQASGGLINFGTIVFSEENSAAFGFLAPARVARDWVGNNTGFWPDSKRVVYPDDDAPRWEPTAPGSIRMDNYPANPYSNERMSEFFHEYGHGVHDEVRPGFGLPGSSGGPTGFDTETDEGTALSEGWAEFFQTAVEHGPSHTPPSGHWYWSRIESGAYWQGKDANMVEGSTACVLWDLYDTANDDGIDQQLSRIWTVMADDDPDRLWSPTSDDDFYTYWVDRFGLDQPGSEAEWRAFDEVFIDQGIPVRDDDGEENDTKAEAFDLGTLGLGDSTYTNLICKDEDWWAFTISAPAAPGDRVSLGFTHTRGDLDLSVYDALDQLVGESAGSSDSETVYLDGQPAGTYYVKVIGHGDDPGTPDVYEGDFNPNYELTISLSSSMSAVPTNLDLPAGYDTGRYDSDDLTSLGSPHIAGFAPPNSTVRVYKGPSGSYTLIGSDTADPSGEFDVALTTPLDEGANEVTATAEESGKTESAHSSPPLVVTVDTQGPEPPSQPDMTGGSDSGRFLNDDVTNSQTPTFEGAADPDAEVMLHEGATPLGNVITPDGDWSITASALGEGTHQISATARDAAGIESAASPALSILIDLTPPDISSTGVAPEGCRPVGIVFDLSLTATDALSGMEDAWSPEATVRNASMSVDIVLPPAGGDEYVGSWDSEAADPDDYSVDFEAFDLAGNSTLIEDAAMICLALPGDHDFDGDVDLVDFGRFQACFTGGGGSAPGGCEMTDMDGDGAVDLDDFSVLQAAFTGP